MNVRCYGERESVAKNASGELANQFKRYMYKMRKKETGNEKKNRNV